MILTSRTRERFLAKVQKTADCWIWVAAKHMNGYGKFAVRDSVGHRFTIRLAHRIAYELFIGEIPHGQEVMHSCDERACVNPSHLSLGDHAVNMADAKAKGRLRGRRTIGRKLWIGSVGVLRLLAASGTRNAELSRATGLNASSISGLLTGRFWANAGGPLKPRRTRLVPSQVTEIRSRYVAGEHPRDILRAFSIGSSQLHRIMRGEDWPNVLGPTLAKLPVGRRRLAR